MWPKFRLSTEFVPEIGHVECLEDGDYTFRFDNSHGRFFGKEVTYRIELC